MIWYGTERAEWFLNIVRCRADPLPKGLTPVPQAVVLQNGEIIKTSSRARKPAAGPELTKLFIGTEGTLGIVTDGAFEGYMGENSCSPDVYYLSDGEAHSAPQDRCCRCPIP